MDGRGWRGRGGGGDMGFSMEVFGAGEGVCVRSDGDDAFMDIHP